jgi:hypothetical protein
MMDNLGVHGDVIEKCLKHIEENIETGLLTSRVENLAGSRYSVCWGSISIVDC